MSQKIEKVKLKNGLQVFFLIDPRYTTSTVQMTFPFGWRNDPKDKIGLAHLFEHLVGKRTEKYLNKGEFATKIGKLGIQANALTTPNSTVYYQNQTHERLSDSLDLILEAIYNSEFNKEDLEKEKGVVLTEAMQHKDGDVQTCWHNTAKNLYPGGSLSSFFFGDEETLGRISVETFEDYYKYYRNPKNAILIVAIDSIKYKKMVLAKLDSFFKAYKNATNVSFPKFKDVFNDVVSGSNFVKLGKNQNSICIGYRTKQLNIEELVKYKVLNKILVHGLTGKFMKSLRDEKGLIYFLGFWFLNFMDTSMLYFQTNCKKEKTQEYINGILEEIDNLRIETSDVKEVENIVKYEVLSGINSYEDVNFFAKTFLSTGEYITTEEYLGIAKSLTGADLNKFVKKIFTRERSVFILE
jgi:predicted Zn-dependent peptidase